MYKYLIFLVVSFGSFQEQGYAMEVEKPNQKNVPENPEVESKEFDLKIYKNRDPFKITEFQVADIIDSRDPRLELEIANSYSGNRQNRVFDKSKKQTISNHVILRVKQIDVGKYMSSISFDILGTADLKKCYGTLKVSYTIKKNNSFANDEIYIDSVKSETQGYGFVGLQVFLRLMEKNKGLLSKIKFFSLVDANRSLTGKKIDNLYQKLGFATKDFLNVMNQKKIEDKTTKINETYEQIDKKHKEIEVLKKDTAILDKQFNSLSEEKMLMQNAFNINPEKLEEYNTLCRSRFLNDKEWQREGSVDKEKDELETPYWKKHPVKY